MAELSAILDATVRRERGRIVGGLVRLCGGLDAAEEAFQDAVLVALEAWRADVPANPGAWLMTTAKNRAKDRLRHRAVATAKAPLLAEEPIAGAADTIDTVADDHLRLVVTCCHPALARDSAIALTLKVVCGFATEEIARALLTTEATVSQRILCAKREIASADLDYSDAPGADVASRTGAVLGVIYAMFNEGHVAHRGPLMQLDLQSEALRLAQLLADLVPADPEAFGVLALIAFAAARSDTRVDDEGVPILLAAQDRARWDSALLREGLMALQRARTLGGRGEYVLQAEIAAVHAVAPAWEHTDWPAIIALYDELATVVPSPIVSFNRAIALSMRDGPLAGLALLDELARALADYHLYFAARADLLERAGKDPGPDLRRALALVANDGERRLLERRILRSRGSI